MKIVLSDIHMGARRTNKECFGCFIEHYLAKEPVEDLILLGDIVDLWRENWEEVLPTCISCFNNLAKLDSVEKIHFVKGNHDYKLLEYLEDEAKLRKLQDDDPSLEINFMDKMRFRRGPSISRAFDPRESEQILVLESEGQKFVFTHGYHFEANKGLGMKNYEKWCKFSCDNGGINFLKLGGFFYDKWDEFFDKEPNKWVKTIEDYISLKAPGKPVNSEIIVSTAQTILSQAAPDETINIAEGVSRKQQEIIKQQLHLHAPPEKRQKRQTPLTKAKNALLQPFRTKLRKFLGMRRRRIHIPMSEDELGKERVYVESGETLIYGHVHQPGIDYQLANTGSWTEHETGGPRSSFLIIDNGKITLRFWPPQQDNEWVIDDRFNQLKCVQNKCERFV